MVRGGRWEGAEDGLLGFSLEVREPQKSVEASTIILSHGLLVFTSQSQQVETPPFIQHPNLPFTKALLDALVEAGFG